MSALDDTDKQQAALVNTLAGQLAAGLRQEGEADCAVIETHISRVLLCGGNAYKFKRPVDLGFLDFSTLERRRRFAFEELRLNQRLAPALYRSVEPVTGSKRWPRLGGDGPVLDYVVRMRRFDQGALLTRRVLTATAADALADQLARFHRSAPSAPADSDYGTPEQVLAPMLDNVRMIRRSATLDPSRARSLTYLAAWTQRSFEALQDTLMQRRRGGWIRECHGDLHRGNVALVDDEPVVFDCIEFSAHLRWIDTMSEIAFLVMDLFRARQHQQARRFLNRYLVRTGDYAGLAVLRFYLVYRALVRAKVTAIGSAQHHAHPTAAGEGASDYLREALFWSRPQPTALVLMCGLSGSGKTFLAARLSERLPLIHLRSDVERKRLFGLGAEARTGTAPGTGIYAPDAGERTYGCLLSLARGLILAGHGVMVDATFQSARHREAFRRLAEELGCPFHILALDAPPALLRRRVAERQATGQDASEAGLAVLAQQLAHREPLSASERGLAVLVDARGVPKLAAIERALSHTVGRDEIAFS